MRNSLLNWKYEKLAGVVLDNLSKKYIEGFYLPARESVVPKLEEILKEVSTVANGGSVTLQETGTIELLRSGKYQFFDKDAAADSSERWKVLRKAFEADYYVCSANAITVSGEIVQLDGSGNRAAACIYGPEKVIFVVGMNKIVPDIEAAFERIRYIAPMNAKRLNLHTPCAATGICSDCRSDERICESYAIIRNSSRNKGHYTVLLVGENLGL